MNFSCPRTVSVHSYVLSCCALHASKYAPSYAHSSWYWAAVRRVICWPALSSYGQLINSSRLGVEMMFRFRFKIHFIIVFVLCLAGGIGEISSRFCFSSKLSILKVWGIDTRWRSAATHLFLGKRFYTTMITWLEKLLTMIRMTNL